MRRMREFTFDAQLARGAVRRMRRMALGVLGGARAHGSRRSPRAGGSRRREVEWEPSRATSNAIPRLSEQ